MANALANNLVAAAQKTFAQAEQAYPRQNVVISGLQPVNSHNVACGTFPEDAPAAQQFSDSMTWVMNACQTAAQQAVEACQYIYANNPIPAVESYLTAATEYLTQLQGSTPANGPGGYLVWALMPDWSNCSGTNGGQCDAGAISCQPTSEWIISTLLVLQNAQYAVQMAANALAVPAAPPPVRYKASRHPPHLGVGACGGGCGGGPSITGNRTLDFVLSHSGRAVAGFGIGVAAAPKPCTATSFAQASTDFQNVIMEALIAGDTYYGEDKKNLLLDYTDAVTAYQAAGQAGATCIGPEIDSVGYPNVTSTFTGQAWTINGQLATLPKSGTPAPNMPSPYYTQADADKAKQLARQMGDLYQQALDAGNAAAPPVNPSQPPGTTTVVPPSSFWPAVAVITVAGAVGTALVMASKTSRRPAHA